MYKASANLLIACSFLWLTACSSAGVVTEDLIPTDYVNPFIGASTSVGAAGVYHGLGKTFPGATTSFSISSTNHVPHSGKVLSIQLCLVISLILLMNLSPFDYNVFLLLRVYYHLHFYISTYFHYLHKCAIYIFSVFEHL